MSTSRRSLVLGIVLFGAVSSCKREARCQRCGMVLDAASRWHTEVRMSDGKSLGFDTPKCAFTIAKTRGIEPTAMTFRGYYTQKSLEGDAVTFAVGSDVQGPMGEDFVPVEPDLANKFQREHGAKKLLRAADITRELAEGL